MSSYLIRRLLLLIPTLLGITAVCFTLIQFVPGGPVEELISRVRAQSSLEGGGGSTTQQQITEEEIEFAMWFATAEGVRFDFFMREMEAAMKNNEILASAAENEIIKDKSARKFISK